jgi:hypothetical protein
METGRIDRCGGGYCQTMEGVPQARKNFTADDSRCARNTVFRARLLSSALKYFLRDAATP